MSKLAFFYSSPSPSFPFSTALENSFLTCFVRIVRFLDHILPWLGLVLHLCPFPLLVLLMQVAFSFHHSPLILKAFFAHPLLFSPLFFYSLPLCSGVKSNLSIFHSISTFVALLALASNFHTRPRDFMLPSPNGPAVLCLLSASLCLCLDKSTFHYNLTQYTWTMYRSTFAFISTALTRLLGSLAVKAFHLSIAVAIVVIVTTYSRHCHICTYVTPYIM